MTNFRFTTLSLLILCATVAAGKALADAPATQSSTQPSVTAMDQTTPRGALKLYDLAFSRGDTEGMKKVLEAVDDQQTKIVNAYCKYNSANLALQNAVLAKFPPKDIDVPTRRAEILKETLREIDMLQEKIEGDDATLVVPNSPADAKPLAKLKRIEGKWMMSFAFSFGDAKEYMSKVGPMEMRTAITNQLAADVSADQFKDKVKEKGMRAIDDAMNQRMMIAEMKAASTQADKGEK